MCEFREDKEAGLTPPTTDYSCYSGNFLNPLSSINKLAKIICD